MRSLLVASLCFAFLVNTTAVQAQTASRIEVPAQPLDQALNELARQTNLQVIVAPDAVAGKRAPAVSGNLAPQAAFDALLTGSGLSATIEGGTVVVRRAEPGAQVPEQHMPVVQVEAQTAGQEESAWGPVEGFVATRSATATKSDTPIIETPRSISVITAEQVQSQSAVNVDEALRYTAGVVTEYRGIDRSQSDVLIRGFDGNIFTDGLRAGNDGFGDFDVDAYGFERVEVLKGPASILYGAGSPGGIINAVSKRPTEDFFAEVELNAGSYDQFGGKFDLGGPLGENKQFLGRLTGVVRDGDSQVDFTKENRVYLAPALTWKAGSDTSLTLLAKYQKDEGPWATFLPAVGTALPNPNGQIPTSRQIGEPNHTNGFDREFYTVGYILEHAFADSWLLRHGLRYNHFTFEGRDSSGWGFDPLLNDDRTVLRGAWFGREEGDALTTDTSLQNRFSWGATEHTVLFGIDYKISSTSSAYGEASPDPSWNLDIFNPVYGLATFPSPAEILRDAGYQDQEQDLSQTGLYVQDQIKAGRWIFSLGGRQDWARSKTNDKLSATTTNDKDHAFTAQAGVVHVFDSGFAPYASYAESFEPQPGTDFLGKEFEPTTGTQYEIGLKYQPPGSGSLFTLAVFEITRQNVLTLDIDNPNFSTQTGEVRSRGAEVEAKVNVSKSLDVIAAYSYMDAKITKSNDGDQGNRPGQTPRSFASLWANYRFAGGLLGGLVLNGGVRHTGSSLDYPNEIEVSSFTLYDFGMRYDLKDQWKGMSLLLNANNLTDKTYVASCEGVYWCIYGPRRVVTAGVRYRW